MLVFKCFDAPYKVSCHRVSFRYNVCIQRESIKHICQISVHSFKLFDLIHVDSPFYSINFIIVFELNSNLPKNLILQ